MAGQAIVRIGNKEWLTDVATLPWELSQGLGGLEGIAPYTGMLFDLGSEQTIVVTTAPMLFPLDIVFFRVDLTVSEVYQGVGPGYLVTSAIPARYFLEVNAGEMSGIEPGAAVSVEYHGGGEYVPGGTDLATTLMPLLGLLAAGGITVIAVKEMAKGVSDEVKAASSVCEIVRPEYYDLLSWVGAPLPDYSFSIEPEVTERKIDDVLKRLKESVISIQENDNFKKFLLTMAKFHDYSIGNLILVMMQKPGATHVAEFSTWKDLGRWVKKGEKGIAILAPCFPAKKAKAVTKEENESDEEIELSPVYFKVVHVFDVSQTEGKPLPEFEVPSLTGEANEKLFESILALAKNQGLVVRFESRLYQDPAIKGTYSGSSIWVRPEEPHAQQLKTLLHEVAHYYSENVFHIPRRDAETIAESAAFTVGAHFGFDSGIRSFPYVDLWSKDKKVLEVNLAAIRKVSAKIIDALEQTKNEMVGMV